MINETAKLDYMLNTLKSQRNILCEDCMKHQYELMHGLREKLPAVRKLYSEKYRIMWIDAHWNTICNLIDENISYEKDKREVIEYFAEHMKTFIAPRGWKQEALTEFFFDQLENEIKIISDMIGVNHKHDAKLNELRNLNELHQIRYEKLINDMLNELNYERKSE